MSDQPKPTAADQPPSGKPDKPGVFTAIVSKAAVTLLVNGYPDLAGHLTDAANDLLLQFPAQPADTTNWKQRAEEEEAELDRERMRLAACGVAALGYFNGCHDDYRSGSIDDVLQLNAQLTADNERLAKVREALKRLGKWAELSPFAESILTEAKAALAEGER